MTIQSIGSPAGSLNWTDLQKVGKGALIAAAGAALTYLSEHLGSVDFGQYTPAVVAGISILINFGWKFLSNNSETQIITTK